MSTEQQEKKPKITFPGSGGNDGDKPNRKLPKFNIYWIYIIIFLALSGSYFIKFAPETNIVSEQEVFQHMILPGDVDHLLQATNSDVVRVYIKPDSITKPWYQDRFKVKFDPARVKGNPMFEFQVVDWKVFNDNLNNFLKANNINQNSVPVITKKDPDFFGPVSSTIISMVIIIALWVLLMRKMGGGASGGGPGGIFSIGKSKAQLFDKGT